MDEHVPEPRVNPQPSFVAEIARQRALSEKLLLAALRERDVTSEAVRASRRATFLASASRELAMSLDDVATHDAVRRRTLLREGSWCIVDIVELDGTEHRLPVAHPDPSMQPRAEAFADRWFPLPDLIAARTDATGVIDANQAATREGRGEPAFGGLLVVPLVVRAAVLGAITFVTREGDAAFSPDEIGLASEIADLCALALDNSRLYREARQLRVMADAANRAKSTFLGNTSHELMTPLNAIGGYVTLIEMGLRGPVTAEQLADLARIRHNQQHLVTLISDILTFVRHESGRLEYHIAAVPVGAALLEVVNMLGNVADERHLTLAQEPCDEHLIIWADAGRVRQILLNLVMNAIKYATADVGGRITLSTSVTTDDVAIHVSDEGPGIPASSMSGIFDPFVQLASGLSDRRGGVGLGLSISRELARAMDGDLTVESTVGLGSRFTLTLPRGVRGSIGG